MLRFRSLSKIETRSCEKTFRMACSSRPRTAKPLSKTGYSGKDILSFECQNANCRDTPLGCTETTGSLGLEMRKQITNAWEGLKGTLCEKRERTPNERSKTDTSKCLCLPRNEFFNCLKNVLRKRRKPLNLPGKTALPSGKGSKPNSPATRPKFSLHSFSPAAKAHMIRANRNRPEPVRM